MSVSREVAVQQEVTAKVNALSNLTDVQRASVQEIAEAFAIKNHGREPNYEGIANLVRSRS